MKKHYFSAIWALSLALIKRTFRDKVALFFTFLFPIMFLLVFGALNNSDNAVSFEVALLNHSTTPFSKQFVDELKKDDSFKVNEEITSFEVAKEKMGRGELDSILEIPADFGRINSQNYPSGNLIVYYQEGSPQSGQTLAAVMQGMFGEINQQLTGIAPPLGVEQRATQTSDLTSFDYAFSGLLGFSILSLGIFGMANSFPAEKKRGSLRRLLVSPLHSSQLIFATALNYLVLGVCSTALMFGVAKLVFHFTMVGSYFDFILFTILAIISMFGFGLAIAGWAKNENQAAPLSNLVAFPMMFLSGVFFPRFLMPEWLQNITGYLPLSPIVDGIRLITSEGKGLLDLGPELLIISIWTVVIYLIAVLVFRWE